jgi:drug/metabolite transporter (DMT)-like permease
MSKKMVLAIILIGLGVITGMLDLFVYGLTGGSPAVTSAFLAAAIACIIAGSVLAFSQLLDRFISPVLEEINKDIEDDIEDIREHRMTNTLFMGLVVGISILVFAFLVFRFHKLEATWGSIPVAVPTLAAIGVLVWFITKTHWFHNQRIYTPMWVFLIPTAGLILTMIIGISKTEDLRAFRVGNQEAIEYNTYQFASFIFQGAMEAGGLELNPDIPSCNGDDCGVMFLVMLVIGLVILSIILVAGSAVIPHFWLFGGSIFISLMAIIAIHDLRVRSKKEEKMTGGY